MSIFEWKLEDALRVKGQEEAEKKAEKIAIKLLDVLDVEKIAETTDLSVERVNELKKLRDKKLKGKKS